MWQDQVGWIRNKTQKTDMFPRHVGTFKNIESQPISFSKSGKKIAIACGRALFLRHKPLV